MKNTKRIMVSLFISILLIGFLAACDPSSAYLIGMGVVMSYRSTSAEGVRPVSAAGVTPCTNGNGEVITTSSGLQYEDLLICDGNPAKNGDKLSVHYIGTFENGDKFDSSYDHNAPFEFELGTGVVIKGWDEGLLGMTVGSKRKLIIPPDLAYGAAGSPPVIPANTTLIFTVQLLSIN